MEFFFFLLLFLFYFFSRPLSLSHGVVSKVRSGILRRGVPRTRVRLKTRRNKGSPNILIGIRSRKVIRLRSYTRRQHHVRRMFRQVTSDARDATPLALEGYPESTEMNCLHRQGYVLCPTWPQSPSGGVIVSAEFQNQHRELWLLLWLLEGETFKEQSAPRRQ